MTENINDNFLTERKPNNTVYLQFYEGMLCQRRSEEYPGFVRYESHNPKTKGKVSWVKVFESLDGYLTGIEKEEKTTQDGSQKYVVFRFIFEKARGRRAELQVSVKADFVAAFAKRIESINLTEPLTFGGYFSWKHGRNVIWFEQNGEKIGPKYTQENPGKLPQWVKDEVSGEWDNRDYWKYLYNLIAAHTPDAMAKNQKMLAEADSAGDDEQQIEETEVVEFDDSDIPF